MIDAWAIRQRWEADGSKRDERGRRLFAASEARAAGWGGLAAVSNITGLARSTIERGLKDLDAPPLAPGQVRREGGGPRPLTETDATLLDDLKRLVEPATLGDPVRPLLWVSKSLDKLASALVAMGHSISPNGVRKLLTEIGFSRQVNRKTDEGTRHPDRNAQLEYIKAEGRSQTREGARLRRQETRQGRALWRVRHDRKCGLGQRRHHPRHRRVRGGGHSHLARKDRAGALSEGTRADDHSGLRRLKRCTRAALESRTAKARRRDRPHDQSPALSAGHVEMEQDRTSPVLPHHPELARPAAHGSCRHRRADRGDNDKDRAQSRERPRHKDLREGHQGPRRRDEMPRHPWRCVPS